MIKKFQDARGWHFHVTISMAMFSHELHSTTKLWKRFKFSNFVGLRSKHRTILGCHNLSLFFQQPALIVSNIWQVVLVLSITKQQIVGAIVVSFYKHDSFKCLIFLRNQIMASVQFHCLYSWLLEFFVMHTRSEVGFSMWILPLFHFHLF